jgi:enoyl-CoA hydratase/carnithine racemase
MRRRRKAVDKHEEQVMALLRDFGKAFNRGNVDGILACVTEDFEWRLAAGPEAPDAQIVRGKEAVRQGIDLPFAEGARLEADLALLLQTTADRAEGIRSFHEKLRYPEPQRPGSN